MKNLKVNTIAVNQQLEDDIAIAFFNIQEEILSPETKEGLYKTTILVEDKTENPNERIFLQIITFVKKQTIKKRFLILFKKSIPIIQLAKSDTSIISKDEFLDKIADAYSQGNKNIIISKLS